MVLHNYRKLLEEKPHRNRWCMVKLSDGTHRVAKYLPDGRFRADNNKTYYDNVIEWFYYSEIPEF